MLVDGADEAKLNEQLQLELAAMKKKAFKANQAVIGSWIDIRTCYGYDRYSCWIGCYARKYG